MFEKSYLKLKKNNPRGVPDDYTYWTSDSISEVLSLNYFDFTFFEPKEDPKAILTSPANTGFYRVEVSTPDGVYSCLIQPNKAGKIVSQLKSEVFVTSKDQLVNIDSSKVYLIDGSVDMGNTSIEVPAGGISIKGLGFNVSGLTSSESNYTLFTSPAGGSGDIVLKDIFITVSGASAKVYDIADATGFSAIEIDSVNFLNCTSLGEIVNYRQGLEIGTGRLGGTPELTLTGNWNGYRISTSIAFNMSDFTSMFKAGAGLEFSGRFVTDINCDLPAIGALFDFSPTNILNDESLIIDGAFVARQGVLDAADTTIYPNIDHTSVKSNWGNNTGMPNTKKYIKANVSTEVVTTIAATNTYYPLSGTFSVANTVQFSMPSNGEFELLTGNGSYNILGTIQVKGTAGDLIDVRVTKSTDGGTTYPVEINHIQEEIANLSGPDDFSTYSVNFIQDLKKGERVRLEVENKTAARNVTMSDTSYLIISEV